MSDFTKAVFGVMDQGAAEFASTYSQLVSTVDTLDSNLRASLDTWTGTAQAAYYEAKAAWDAAMADMAIVVQQLGQVVDAASSNFQQAESANRALWA
jgi:6 kDa early secretory antigenic target